MIRGGGLLIWRNPNRDVCRVQSILEFLLWRSILGYCTFDTKLKLRACNELISQLRSTNTNVLYYRTEGVPGNSDEYYQSYGYSMNSYFHKLLSLSLLLGMGVLIGYTGCPHRRSSYQLLLACCFSLPYSVKVVTANLLKFIESGFSYQQCQSMFSQPCLIYFD